MKKAIYAGSFDPFTNGHFDIIKQASEIFDVIYLVFAVNNSKSRIYDINKMEDAVRKTLEANDINNCLTYYTERLISDYAKSKDINYLIRGLRNPNDYNYEENIAKINRELNPDLKTIYFRSDNEIVSSTLVRELHKYGKDVSKYVSPYVLGVMQND